MEKTELKKTLLGLAAIAALGTVGGCYAGKNEKKTDAANTTTESDSTEIITSEDIIVTEEETEMEEVSVDTNEKIESIVENSYNSYQEYYDSNNISKDDIRIMIQLLNDNYEGLNEDNVDDSCRIINQILCSDNLEKKVRSIHDQEETDIDVKLVRLPKVSEFFMDEEATFLPIIKRVEDDRDLVINTIESTGDYRSIVEEFNNDVVDMFYDTSSRDNGLDTEKLENESQLFAVAASKYAILNLAAILNPEKEYIEGNNIDETTGENQKVKIAYNSKEQDLENTILQADILGLEVSPELVTEYANIRTQLKKTEYENKMCDYLHSMQLNIEEKSKVYQYQN